MLFAAIIDCLFGIAVGLWLGQTQVGKGIINVAKKKVDETFGENK